MTTIVKNPNYDVDVDRLDDVFSDLIPDGRTLRHTQIEAALGVHRATARYRTVVRKWRRRLRERCLILDGELARGEGFIVLTPDGMVNHGNRNIRSAGRKLRRAINDIALPRDEQLSDAVRQQRALLGAAMERIAHQQRSELRLINQAVAAQRQLPRKAG